MNQLTLLSGRLRELRNKGKSSWVIPKWSRSLSGAVAYENFLLKASSSDISNGVSQRWS